MIKILPKLNSFYPAQLCVKAGGRLGLRDGLAAIGALGTIFWVAAQAVDGPLATPSPDIAETGGDPILAEVGPTPIRLSDARAQVAISDILDTANVPTLALFETGLVDEMADQVALAALAEREGLDETLEIKAELALARRRILSSAYLDQAIKREVSETHLKAAYAAEQRAAAADRRVVMRRLLVSSEKEAQSVARRIQTGIPFGDMARRVSLDFETRSSAGLLPPTRVSQLPTPIGETVAALPLGTVSAPVATEEGWYLLIVESRNEVKIPPYEELRPRLMAELQRKTLAQTVAKARNRWPIRTVEADFSAPSSMLALAETSTVTW